MRIDQWLWAVRLCKTRAIATAACRGGHVKVNGRPAKAATPVRAGDRVEAYLAQWQRVVDVVQPIGKRVGAKIAADCLLDHSEPRPPRDFAPPPFRRDPGAGRPTKKDRRRLDRLRNR